MSMRRTEYKKIQISSIDPYYANPPNRTDLEKKDFQNLKAFVAGGGTVPAITVVLDSETGRYQLVGGHRRRYAHLLNGVTEIPAEVTYPNAGETAAEVQQEMWAQQHKGRAIVGKDFFFTALETNGKVLMTPSVAKAYKLVEKHVKLEEDRNWLKQVGTPDLLFISQKIADKKNNIATANDEALTPSQYSMFFRQTMRYLIRHRNQREVRDYLKTTSGNCQALITAIEKDKYFAAKRRSRVAEPA
jgi:hypothetical protein